ncbi:hypothetical protein ACP4OV_029290 [Aristida adscensionis]
MESSPGSTTAAVLAVSEVRAAEAVVAATIIAIVGTCVLQLLLSPERRRRRGRLPPSPASLPVIGHLHHLLRPPVHRALHELAGRVGPLMHLRLGSTPCVVASSAGTASELIRGHEASISDRPVTAVVRRLSYGAAGFGFAPYSAHWRFMKRLCMAELLGPRAVEQLRPIRRAGLASLLRAVLRRSSSPSPAVVYLSRELIRMSNTSMIRMVAGTAPGSEAEEDEAQELVKAVSELIGAVNVGDYIAACRGWDLQGLGRRAADVHRRFDALLEEMLRHKEAARRSRPAAAAAAAPEEEVETKQDLLDILLDKAEDKAAEVNLTRDNIKAFIKAGPTRRRRWMEWMLAELLNHPAALRKVREEIDRVVGGGRIAGEADLPSLPDLQAAYRETLRLHPAAPMAHRQSSAEMQLAGGGFTVPAGAAVLINVWAIGRDPAFWEEPLAFRPERFMPGGAAEGLDPRGQSFNFMPFGSGRRACPGMGLALWSVPAVLAALVQCFDWAPSTSSGDGDGKIDMEESDGLVCARNKPLLLRPTPRLHPFPPIV